MRRKNKAQTLIEYAVLIGVAVSCLIAMGIFMRRQVQGRFRQSADIFGEGEQYEKGLTQVVSLDAAGEDIDELGSEPKNPCATIQAEIAGLEKEITVLRNRAVSFEQRAAEVEAQAQILVSQGLSAQAEPLLKNSRDLRAQAQAAREKADREEVELNKDKADYAQLCV